MAYLSKEELDACLIEYFKQVQHTDETDAEFIMMDFEDPYDCPWIAQDFIEIVEIDGHDFNKRACCTNFSFFAATFSDIQRFKFYMYLSVDEDGKFDYERDTLYQVDDIRESDFSMWE